MNEARKIIKECVSRSTHPHQFVNNHTLDDGSYKYYEVRDATMLAKINGALTTFQNHEFIDPIDAINWLNKELAPLGFYVPPATPDDFEYMSTTDELEDDMEYVIDIPVSQWGDGKSYSDAIEDRNSQYNLELRYEIDNGKYRFFPRITPAQLYSDAQDIEQF